MNWKKYGGEYLVALIAVTLAYYLLDLVLGGGGASSSMMLLAPVIAAIYPSSAFVKDHRRIPSPGERWRLLGLCVGIFAVVQAVQIGVVTAIFFDEARAGGAATVGFLAISFLATLLLEIALMWLLFRFHPGWLLKSIRKADERKAAKER